MTDMSMNACLINNNYLFLKLYYYFKEKININKKIISDNN